MVESPSSAEENTAAMDTCRACRQPIPKGATVCTQCGAHQTLWGQVAVAVKWAGGAATIVSLLIGMNSLFGIYRGQLERVDAISEIAAAADRLRDDGNYSRAWALYDEAGELDPASRRVRRGREELARQWLPNVRVTGDETFTGVVDRTLPVLLLGAARADPSDAADFEALVGWAHALEARERGISDVDIPAVYRRAIAMDSDNALANMFLGHWMASEELDLDQASPCFEVALRDPGKQQLVRRFQWSALANLQHRSRDERALRVASEQLRVVHEMLVAGEPLDNTGRQPGDIAVLVQQAYGSRVAAGAFDALWPRLDPEVHRLVIEKTRVYLEPGSSYAYHAEFLLALIDEKLGNEAAALAAMQKLDPEVTPNYVLRTSLDEAIERLSGQPTMNAMRRRDPLGFHGKALGNAEPGTDEFTKAMKAVVREVESMGQGGDLADVDRAVDVLSDARRRSDEWLASHPQAADAADRVRDELWSLGIELGDLLLVARRLDAAIDVYSGLAEQTPPSAWMRNAILYNLACAYSLRAQAASETDARRGADLDAGAAMLIAAVEAGMDDWDHIKRDGDLTALRDHPEYKRIMAGR